MTFFGAAWVRGALNRPFFTIPVLSQGANDTFAARIGASGEAFTGGRARYSGKAARFSAAWVRGALNHPFRAVPVLRQSHGNTGAVGITAGADAFRARHAGHLEQAPLFCPAWQGGRQDRPTHLRFREGVEGFSHI